LEVSLFRLRGLRKVWISPSTSCEDFRLRKCAKFTFTGSESHKAFKLFSGPFFPAPSVPVVGLVLMACKRVAAVLTTVSESPNPPTWWTCLSHRLWFDGQLEEEVEKALTTLRMVGWRNRSKFPMFEVKSF
jgi:hypothetical protein